MSSLVAHPKLFNVDSKGKVRFWSMETEGGKHRTVSGLMDGKAVTSGWVVVEAKNVGRANATTVEEQALLEVESDYRKKLEGKYYRSLEEAEAAGSGMKYEEPMLAYSYADHGASVWEFDGTVFCQPKLDGIRCIATADGLMSRRGKPIDTCPHIVRSLESFFSEFPGAILDGELYNHELRDDFNSIQSLVTKKKSTAEDFAKTEELVQYHVYDMKSPVHPFSERILFLEGNLDRGRDVKLVHTEPTVDRRSLDLFYSDWLEAGYEGQMVRVDAPYKAGRTKLLLKRKEFVDHEYPVSEVRPGLGNWAGCAKKVEFILPDDLRDEQGNRPEAGCRGTIAFLKEVYDRSVAGDPPSYVTVRFPNFTPGGMPRFGVVTAFYWGERET